MNRITCDPRVMGGKPCLRGMRVTVGTIVGLLAAGAQAPATPPAGRPETERSRPPVDGLLHRRPRARSSH